MNLVFQNLQKIINLFHLQFQNLKLKIGLLLSLLPLFYFTLLGFLKTDLLNNSESFRYSDLNPFTYKKNDNQKNLNFKINSVDSKVDLSSVKHESIENTKTIVINNNINKDETILSNPVSNKVVNSSSFEVIIGSFSDESNAKKLIKKLSKKSFKARQLAYVNKLFRVSAGKFSSKENAIEYQNTIRKKFKISSWILINAY